MPSTDIAAFRNLLSKSKHIIVAAGPGLSAASEALVDIGENLKQRLLQLRKHSKRIPLVSGNSIITAENPHSEQSQTQHIMPSPALPHPISAQPIAPPNSTFTIITQNVDGLSPKSLDEVSSSVVIPEDTAEHPHIVEMHGRLFDVLCTRCHHIVYNTNSPLCEALAGTEKLLGPEDFEVNIPLEKLPRCEKCGGLARPGVVWFGEIPRHLTLSSKLAQEADLCLVVGTSSTVYPAAGYADTVSSNGGKIAVFNLERTPGDEDADFLFLGSCEQTLPAAALGITERLVGEGEITN